jgi:hypothetical protein
MKAYQREMHHLSQVKLILEQLEIKFLLLLLILLGALLLYHQIPSCGGAYRDVYAWLPLQSQTRFMIQNGLIL